MNDQTLKCEIVRDLLPSYIDGLTSEGTNKAIEEHLATCEDCRKVLDSMKEPAPEKEENNKEVDYLKKVRKHTKKMVALAICIVLVIGLVGTALKIFVFGTTVSEYGMHVDAEVKDNTVTVNGSLNSSATGVSKVYFTEDNGVVTLHVKEALVGIYREATFSGTYTAKDEIHMVQIGNKVIWEDGLSISELTRRLYRARTSFVGDHSADAEILRILGIDADFGTYALQLQTDQEPYGLTIVLNTASDQTETMQKDSIVLLALIDNLDSVSWQDKEEKELFTLSSQEACDLVQTDIKTSADSLVNLQKLLNQIHLH